MLLKCVMYPFPYFPVVSVGFQRDSYTCRENEPDRCQVCVVILNPSRIDENLFLSLFAATVSGTAKGKRFLLMTV